MRRLIQVFILLVAFQLPAPVFAGVYANKKLFDIPTGAAKFQDSCAKWAVYKVPKCHGLKCRGETVRTCIAPTHIKVALETRDVAVVITGPDNVDQSVQKAVVGYATGCLATALVASAGGPQLVAAPATFFATFEACIASISVGGTVGAVLRQVNIHFDTSQTHWSPL
jgi:hypothetical protein